MNRKGQALIEFVIILPIFILILFAVVDFGNIINKKNELENNSTDIVMLYKNNTEISDIKGKFSDINIVVSEEEDSTKITIDKDINVMTPGLNLILGNPYKITIERIIPNDKTK